MNQRPPLPPGIPDVSPEVANRNLLEVAQELNDRLMVDLEAAFPKFMARNGIPLTPSERIEKLMLMILQAHPSQQYMAMLQSVPGIPAPDKLTTPDVMQNPWLVDQQAAHMELGFLLNPDYLDLIKQGQAPPPVARPWAKMITVPPLFRAVAKIFRQDFNSQMRRTAS